MDDNNKIPDSEIVPTTSNIDEEIALWEARLAEKEKEASELSIQIQDIKNALSVFLGEYNSRVGLLYVELDKLKMQIKEYQRRIDLARGKKLSWEDLESIEEEVDETFSQERQKIDDLENEASESSEEYRRHLEAEEKRHPLSPEFQQQLKTLFRKLALKFHPDKAKNDQQRKEFHEIFAAINEAYKNDDIETLKKYMEQAEREEKIAKETPEEKLVRLKEEYKTLLGIIAKLQEELKSLKASETYELKERVDQAKKDDRDLLQELADDIKAEMAENQTILDELIAEYKRVIGGVSNYQ
ncbi:hypothetical protein FJZ31_08765 [Candidatus Poribacteria bacterium]|nr:hypothetical protein [Candidatus Poribacteria bacterium]